MSQPNLVPALFFDPVLPRICGARILRGLELCGRSSYSRSHGAGECAFERYGEIFLEGINEERITEGYRRFQPGSSSLRTPIFLSSGLSDPIATIEQQTAVKNAMQRTGFTNIRHETFPDGHVVLPTQVQKALRWFRKGS